MKKLLAILMVLALACGCAFAEETEEDALSAATVQIREMPVIETQDNGILVVFFSPDVTTRAAAYAVAAGLNAELFEIIPEELYTEEDLDYTNNFSRSEKEQRDKTARPAISRLPEDLTKYDTIFLGYPIWNAMAPKILYTFVESVDLSGKTIIPFCTSGSSSIGSSAKDLQKLTDDSVIWKDGGRIKKGNSTTDGIIQWVQEELLAPEE